MEAYLYLAVKIAIAAYVLRKAWEVLFEKKLLGVWDRIPVKKKKQRKRNEILPVKKEIQPGVVGKTNKVFLDDPRKAEPEPVGSIDLESTGFIGQDEPIAEDDVETLEQPYIPSEDELYDELSFPDGDTDYSSGVSFEELSEVADVLQKGTEDDDKKIRAAKTVYNVQNTEIFNFLAEEISNKRTVENLMRECLDGDGMPINKKAARTEGFNIDSYV